MNIILEMVTQEDILVVDDKHDNLRLLSTMLVERGYKVRKALSGEMALMAIYASLPDLILLDINMPNMNGYQVCETLRQSDLTQHIPIIFISALDDVTDKVEAFRKGGNDYITKPFEFDEVVARVENQLKIRRLQKQLQEQNERLQQEIADRVTAEATLKKANQRLQELAIVDDLTQIANRRHFYAYFHQEWPRLLRENAPMSVILCDIDHFKLYNDTYLHLAGDECLQKVAHAINSSVKRPADLVARYGGEEFGVILPNTLIEGGLILAEDIRLRVQDLKIPHARSPVDKYVSLSLGVSGIIPSNDFPPEMLIGWADEALYEAKRLGRNRSCVKVFTSVF
jgi:diguanylate cyclase (GGDEF)-like protein